MRRSRRVDADTPRDTPGNVEATRAAANAASSEEDSSCLSPLDKEPVRGTSGFDNMDNNKDYTSEYCYQPRSLKHAPGVLEVGLSHPSLGVCEVGLECPLE